MACTHYKNERSDATVSEVMGSIKANIRSFTENTQDHRTLRVALSHHLPASPQQRLASLR